ncbi:sensor histidine kinase [Streptomyces fungicidicus]|uniref:sensor histidine kinase n=1 Tax=Streptomyces fungicidicus TaxID=68203 RepID=UPI0033F506D1
MDAQRGPGGGPPGRWPRQWWHGPPGRAGRPGEGHGAGEAADGDGGHGRPRWPWRSTLLFTAFVLAGSQFAAHSQEVERVALDPAARVLLFVAGALLLWRWRRPVPVLCATVAAVLLYNAAGYPYGPVFLTVAVACFSAVVSGHRHAAWAAMGAFWAGHVLIAQLLYRWLPPSGDGAVSWNEEIVVATWVVALVAVSELVRTRREQWARERAERARAARRRADEERLRIARELHDVLAHSISVIHVQAGVGLALLDSDPEQARTALTTIKAQSKEALGEVRQVLDTLRAPGAAPRAPAPGLDRLPELVEQAAGAGLTVTVEGEPPALPPGADLAAFRIVQEALTNVVRHSGSREARVRIEQGGGRLRLRVDDDGPATGDDAGGGGNGLAGMRERAAALNGTIEAGPRPDGGFRVLAELPLASGEDR